jgi:hypothetical protein
MLALPYALTGLVLAVAVACGLLYGRRLHRRGVSLDARLRARELPLIPMTIIVFVAVVVGANQLAARPALAWHLPLTIEYYFRPIFWTLKLFFITFPMAAISRLAYLNRHRARHLILTFTLAAIAAVEIQLRLTHRPYLGDAFDKRTPAGIILQSTGATCAAASSANVARAFGLDVNEADLIRILNTTWEGTSPAQVVYGMRSLGLDARKASSARRDLSDITPPAVLFVDFAELPDGHAVAYMKREGDQFEIWDPTGGRRLSTAGQVRDTWRGHAVEVRERVEKGE